MHRLLIRRIVRRAFYDRGRTQVFKGAIQLREAFQQLGASTME